MSLRGYFNIADGFLISRERPVNPLHANDQYCICRPEHNMSTSGDHLQDTGAVSDGLSDQLSEDVSSLKLALPETEDSAAEDAPLTSKRPTLTRPRRPSESGIPHATRISRQASHIFVPVTICSNKKLVTSYHLLRHCTCKCVVRTAS